VCVFTFLILDEFKSLMISLILLFCCREEFPLIGLPLTLVLIADRKPSRAILVFILTATWLGFVFYLRPRLFEGHFQNYGGGLLRKIIEDPFEIFKKNFTSGSLRMALERTFPLLVLIDYRRLKQNFRVPVMILLVSLPILSVRFASNQWAFHYGTAAIVCAFFIFYSGVPITVARWRWALSILFLIGTFIAEPIKVFANHQQRCPSDPRRISEITRAQNIIASSGNQNILLENNLASTQFLRSPPGQNLYLLCSPSGSPIENFDAVLVEKAGAGDPWPCGYERVEELVKSWRATEGVKIVIDNPYVFVAEGKIRETPTLRKAGP
jgi:hypothetical protein